MRTNRSAILGIILILIGMVIIGTYLDIIPWKIRHIILSWEMILIAVGTILLVNREGSVAGWILIAIGAFFLIPDIFSVPQNWGRLFWPAIFIILGLLLIFRVGGFRHRGFDRVEIEEGDVIDDVAIFGGGERIITSQNFSGGRITAIFGGSKLDFKRAKLAQGKVYIDYFAMFGGTNMLIPEDWEVLVQITPIFGGFSDKRTADPHIVRDPSKQLIIKGVAIFGGGELKTW